MAKLIDNPNIAVFHLASVVSAGAEQDFELAMRVNLDGHRHVLDAMAALGSSPKICIHQLASRLRRRPSPARSR